MKYYRRYIGDYQRDTAHLSLCEHGAYTVLLDAQYGSEQQLPSDYPSLYRLCRAMEPEEQAAVRAVADQFFPISYTGMRSNQRAEKELKAASIAIDEMRAGGAVGAARRWGKNRVPHTIPHTLPYRVPDGVPHAYPIGYRNAVPNGDPNGDRIAVPIDPPTLKKGKEKEKEKDHNTVRASRSPTHAGCRLDRDWQPSESVERWAKGQGVTNGQLAKMLEEFRDYWCAVPGAKGRKLDWDATLRNRIRQQVQMHRLPPSDPTDGAI